MDKLLIINNIRSFSCIAHRINLVADDLFKIKNIKIKTTNELNELYFIR
jgi:hypothetical protein